MGVQESGGWKKKKAKSASPKDTNFRCELSRQLTLSLSKAEMDLILMIQAQVRTKHP